MNVDDNGSGGQQFPGATLNVEDFRPLFRMLPWVPFVFTFGPALIWTLTAQIVLGGVFRPRKPITHGSLLIMFLASVGVATAAGLAVKGRAESVILPKLRERGYL
jgi:hypothetical protein